MEDNRTKISHKQKEEQKMIHDKLMAVFWCRKDSYVQWCGIMRRMHVDNCALRPLPP
jgi:hypothetical protein